MNAYKSIAVLMFATAIFACSSGSDSGQHRPVFSPDGKKIVYMAMNDATAGDWELFLMNSNGSNPVRLTRNEGWDGYAVWSPDQDSIVFDRAVDGVKGPHIMDIASGDVEALGPFDGWMAISGWSADGSTFLAFHEVDKQRDLYLLNQRGEVIRQLTDTPGFNEHDAQFSPDGTSVAYANGPRGGSGSSLEIIDLETGETTILAESDGGIYGVAWSPNGLQIAYTDNPPGGEDDDADVWLLDIASGKTRQLTDNDAWDHMPVFRPDGKILLFTSYRSGAERIYQYDLGSGDVTQLIPGQ